MESVNLDMEDIFGEREEHDSEMQMPAAHPDMDEDDAPMMAEGNPDEEDNEAVLANIKNLVKGASKKRVMRPQPKLDGARLKTSRGLPALVKLFDGVKFKGKGHEAADLYLLMTRLEHWSHRLFPKMTFDECIQRLEKLGAKREVRTCLSRIRLDLPVLDEDFGQNENDENVMDSGNQGDDVDDDERIQAMADMADELLGGDTPLISNRSSRIEDEEDEFDFFDGAPSEQTPQKPSNSSQLDGNVPHTPSTPISQPDGSVATPGSMSQEQKERAEKDKMAALAKRAARLGVPVSALMSPKMPSSQRESQSHDLQSPEVPDSTNNHETADQEEEEANPREDESLTEAPTSQKSVSDCADDHYEGEEDMQTEDQLLESLENSEIHEDAGSPVNDSADQESRTV